MTHDDPTVSSGGRELDPDQRRIGRFVLRRVIASGAMGTVYEAIQDHPRRPVAIKVIKRGVTSSSALRRFEFEAQLLARLRHPGVAEIYEAGTYDDGSGPVPYFAMEYVPNASSITAFADAHKLDSRARLRIFAQVCDALQHGHQKGIVHRDLKPDNIIVGPDGQPKIIDFGVARATDSDLAFATLQTHVGQLVGTLQYMSPEQVDADPHDIDIRSDVYSLGIILHELLVGRPPYDVTGVTTLEALRRIRESSPTRHGTTDRKLTGDAETVVLKALQKDRERRYQSAGELAADIRHILDRQPITARPPTLIYTLQVFTRRNRALVGALAAVFVVLLAGVVTSTTLYVRAEAQRTEAERQAGRTLNAISFVDDLVRSADPTCVGEQVLVADLLDRYGKRVGKAFPDDPEIEAAIRLSIGDCYTFLDLHEKGGKAESYQEAARTHMETAVTLLRGVHGPDHPEVTNAMATFADLLENQGRHRQAETVRRDVLTLLVKRLGRDDPETLAAELAIADLLDNQGRYEEAEQIARDVLEKRRRILGEDDIDTIDATCLLATILTGQGKLQDAESLARQSHAAVCREFGGDSRQARYTRRLLSGILLAEGKTGEPEKLYENSKLPPTMSVDHWVQGEATPEAGSLRLIVALESWCPFSARAMPVVEEFYEAFGDRGLEIIGLTQMSRNSTDEKVQAFIAEHGITFPLAKVTQDVSDDLYPGGVPYAVLARDATIVWSGQPSEISRATFEGLLAAR